MRRNLINLIKYFEGCRLIPYYDTTGTLTVGYGHLTNSKKKITQAQAEKYLSEDLKKFESRVKKQPYELNYFQYMALVSFDFNTGSIDRLTQSGQRSLTSLPSYMVQYRKSKGQVIPGLEERRKIEVEVFNCWTSRDLKYIFNKYKIPYVDTEVLEAQEYVIGKTYTLLTGLKVREEPWGRVLSREELTQNAQDNDINPRNGCLDVGTRVTCLEIFKDTTSVWIRIPSKWVCAIENGKVYIQ